MDIIINILLKIFAFIFAICLSILVHEFCHFWMARRLGVKVLSFSIGFGKPFYKWTGKDGTIYMLAPFLIGGYVKMLESTTADKKFSNKKHLFFDKKPLAHRAAIVIAGAFGNFILAIFFFWLVFSIGMEMPKTIIGKIEPNSKAAQAQLLSGDEIISINQNTTHSWSDVILEMLPFFGEKDKFPIAVKRDNQIITKPNIFTFANWNPDFYKTDPLKDLGIMPYHPILPAIIDNIKPDSPAAKFKLQKGDKIIVLDKQPIKNWDEFMESIKKRPNQTFFIKIERHKKILQLPITSGWRLGEDWEKIGYLGISPLYVKWPVNTTFIEKYNPFSALPKALQQSSKFCHFNLLLFQKILTGKISLHMLGGPLMIFQSASSALQQGFLVYLRFLAILNTTLVLANLLPIPGLDGGYFIFLTYEAIRRKPLSARSQLLFYRLGIIFLIIVMIQAMVNDLMRIVGNFKLY